MNVELLKLYQIIKDNDKLIIIIIMIIIKIIIKKIYIYI